jgi:hypothetical protein
MCGIGEIKANPPAAIAASPFKKGGTINIKSNCFVIFRPLFEGGSLKGWGICFKRSQRED